MLPTLLAYGEQRRDFFPALFVLPDNQVVIGAAATLAKTYRVRNLGLPITDLSIQALDPATGLPARVLLQPTLDHARLAQAGQAGDSLHFEVIPLFSPEDAIVLQAAAHAGASPGLASPLWQSGFDVILVATVLNTSQSLAGTFACQAPDKLYAVTLQNVRVSYENRDWYCTNRPAINLNFSTPGSINVDDILGATVTTGFNPAPGWQVRPHDVRLLLNGQAVGELLNQVPSGSYTFQVDPAFFNPAANPVQPVNQSLGLRTTHLNGGHYVVNTASRLDLDLANFTRYVCAENPDDARDKAGQGTQPIATGLTLRIANPPANAELELSQPVTLEAEVNDEVAGAMPYPVWAVITYTDHLTNGSPLTETLTLPFIASSGITETYRATWTPAYTGAVVIRSIANAVSVNGFDTVNVTVTRNVAAIKILQPENSTVIDTPTVTLRAEVMDNKVGQVVTYPVRATIAYQDVVFDAGPYTETLDLVYESSDEVQNKDFYTGVWAPTYIGDVLMTAEVNDESFVDANNMKPNDTVFVSVTCPTMQPLSHVGQAISDTVRPPAMSNCGSTFEELLIIPPYPDKPDYREDGTYAFEQFANAIREAKYEVDFTALEWNTDFEPESPGDIILGSIRELFLAVTGDISKYPEGMTIRILMGSPRKHQSKEFLLKEITSRGIPINQGTSWRIEIADYPQVFQPPARWSHVKTLIVDGKTVIVGGYNVDDTYMLDPAGEAITSDDVWRDMGMRLSGEIAQETLAMFGHLWEGSTVCTDYDETQEVCTSVEVAGPPTHVPQILNPPLTGNGLKAFSLFRDHNDPTAEQAIYEAMSASQNTLRLIQDRITYAQEASYPRPLYIQGIYNALDNGSKVQYIVEAWEDWEFYNWTMYCDMKREYALRHPLTSFTFEAKNAGVYVHTKSLAIDGEMLIVGSSNFDLSSWNNPPDWYSLYNLAEYNIAVDDPGVAQQYDNYFTEFWNNASQMWCSILDPVLVQGMVDQAQANDIIILPEGIYQESVVINKPLHILGMSGKRTVIEPPPGQPAFRITSSGVSIHHLTVRDSTGYGIELDGSAGSSLEDIWIRRVLFENNASGGIFVQGSPMSYIIENNTFVGGSRGIRLDVPVQSGVISTLRNNLFYGQSAAPIKIDAAIDGGVEYGYNLFDNCERAVNGDCPLDWYEGTLSAVSSAHDNLLNLDPEFDTATGYYTLLPGSPAIDAGDPTTRSETDFDGYVPKRTDIGAFETELMLDPDDSFQEAGGQVVMEAEHFIRNFGRDGHTWQTQTSLPGATDPGYLSAAPDTDLRFTTVNSGNPQLDYTINFTTTGTYYVWLRGYAPNAAGDSIYVGLNDQPVITLTGFAPRMWSWANHSPQEIPVTIEITGTGEHVLHLWMREDGLRIDRLLLTTNSGYQPTDNGPAESERAN